MSKVYVFKKNEQNPVSMAYSPTTGASPQVMVGQSNKPTFGQLEQLGGPRGRLAQLGKVGAAVGGGLAAMDALAGASQSNSLSGAMNAPLTGYTTAQTLDPSNMIAGNAVNAQQEQIAAQQAAQQAAQPTPLTPQQRGPPGSERRTAQDAWTGRGSAPPGWQPTPPVAVQPTVEQPPAPAPAPIPPTGPPQPAAEPTPTDLASTMPTEFAPMTPTAEGAGVGEAMNPQPVPHSDPYQQNLTQYAPQTAAPSSELGRGAPKYSVEQASNILDTTSQTLPSGVKAVGPVSQEQYSPPRRIGDMSHDNQKWNNILTDPYDANAFTGNQGANQVSWSTHGIPQWQIDEQQQQRVAEEADPWGEKYGVNWDDTAKSFALEIMNVYSDVLKGRTPDEVGHFAAQVFLKMTR